MVSPYQDISDLHTINLLKVGFNVPYTEY